MKNACSAAAAEGGSFVVSARPGLPPSPDAPLLAFDRGAAAGIVRTTPEMEQAARVALAGEYRARGCKHARGLPFETL